MSKNELSGSDASARLYLDDVKKIAEALKKQTAKIDQVTDILYRAWTEHRSVFIAGNGGSAGTATHFAADLAKTIVPSPDIPGIRAISLADNIPLASALVNDWGWGEVYEAQLRTFWQPGGVLVAFSVHGGSGTDRAGQWSQNLLKAMQFVKNNGGTTIGFSGFDGGAMKDLADVCVVVYADSTPLVESFHVVLSHLVTFAIKDRIAARHMEVK